MYNTSTEHTMNTYRQLRAHVTKHATVMQVTLSSYVKLSSLWLDNMHESVFAE